MPSINLNFNNNYGIYIFVYLFLPFLFFYKTKIVNFTKSIDFSLSSATSNQLKGIFIIIVILHHISQRMEFAGLLYIFHAFGSLVVGGFFFISGMGLTKSLKRNPKYLDGFLHKKIARIYLPFIMINILTTVTLYLYGAVFTYSTLVQYILSLKLIDSTLWFVVTIMIFYLFFYISFKNNYNLKSLFFITLLIIIYILTARFLDQGGWTYISSLCFPLGIYYVFFEEKLNSIISKHFVLTIIVSVILFLIAFVLLKTRAEVFISAFLSPIFFTIFVSIVFLKIQPQTLLFNFIGTISLEIYLLHMKVLTLFSYLTEFDSGIWIIIYLLSLIVSAFVFHKFNSYIYTKFTLVFNK